MAKSNYTKQKAELDRDKALSLIGRKYLLDNELVQVENIEISENEQGLFAAVIYKEIKLGGKRLSVTTKEFWNNARAHDNT